MLGGSARRTGTPEPHGRPVSGGERKKKKRRKKREMYTYSPRDVNISCVVFHVHLPSLPLSSPTPRPDLCFSFMSVWLRCGIGGQPLLVLSLIGVGGSCCCGFCTHSCYNSFTYFSPLIFLIYSLHAPNSCLLFLVYILISFYRLSFLSCAALLFMCSLMHSMITHAQSCTVLHSLLTNA